MVAGHHCAFASAGRDSRILGGTPTVRNTRLSLAALLLLSVTAAEAQPRPFKILASLGYYGGANPSGGLLRGVDGAFYGTTQLGGIDTGGVTTPGWGTVFKLSADG